MTLRRLSGVLAMTVAAAAAGAALAQTPGERCPDFGGIWTHPATGFGPALKGPGPIRNLSRTAKGTGDNTKLVGDYNNPILKPEAAAIIKRRGEVSISGKIFPDPDAMCLQQPVPYILWNFDVVFVQQKDKVTLIYQHDNDFRQVWLNQAHPANLEPSAHGHSVGHYEGDTLVSTRSGSRSGRIRRSTGWARPTATRCMWSSATGCSPTRRPRPRWTSPKRNGCAQVPPSIPTIGATACSSNSSSRTTRCFTMPWSATITYLKRERTAWEERICAENVEHDYNFNYFSDNAKLPADETPDF